MHGYAVNREPLPRAPEWSADAFCAGLVRVWSPQQIDALVFPPDEESTVGAMNRMLCSHCAVRPQCLDYAVETNAQGNWAGTTTANRQAIRRRRARAKCPVCLSPNIVLDEPGATSLERLHQVCRTCGHSWLTDQLLSGRPDPDAGPALAGRMGPLSLPPAPKRLTVKGRNRAVVTVELPEVV